MSGLGLSVRMCVSRIGLACAATLVLAACGGTSETTTPSVARTAPPAATIEPSPTSVPSQEVGAVCTLTPLKFDPKAIDLTGPWAGDDGGIYYIRQLGTVIAWNGMSGRGDPPTELGRDWNNVARGEIQKDFTILVDWADVPRGHIHGYGTLNLKVGPDASGNIEITKTSETGTGFGNTVWTRCAPGFPASRAAPSPR